MDKKNKFSLISAYACAITLMLYLTPVSADEVTWDMDGTQFTGVNGIQVGLDYYDVDFVEGSCLSLFSYCGGGGAYDLAFSRSDAQEASEQLLAAIDNISLVDTPSLMFGIDNSWGMIFTAYDDDGGGVEDIFMSSVINAPDLLVVGRHSMGVDVVTDANEVWAVWTTASPH